MAYSTVTDEFIQNLFDNPYFIYKLKKICETESVQKVNDLTLSQCSQMETSSQSFTDSESIVQEISVILMDSISQNMEDQLKTVFQSNNILLKEIQKIRAEVSSISIYDSIKQSRSYSQLLSQCISRKQHEKWKNSFINQVTSGIENNVKQVRLHLSAKIADLDKTFNAKLEKNCKTINHLHQFIQDKNAMKETKKQLYQDCYEIWSQKEKRERQIEKQKELQKEKQISSGETMIKQKEKKIQFAKSLESLGNFFNIGHLKSY